MPESPRIPTVPEISQSAARSGRLAARTTVACAATDSGPACLRACVGEAVSWRSPVRTGLVQPRRAHRGYVGNSADSNGGKSQIAQPGRDARAITPAKRVSPDNSPRPSAESDFDLVNRCVVFQDAATAGASNDVILRDANDRPWLAGPAPALPSTGATTIARTAKADGQMGESADSNERGRSTGDAGQDSRAGGLDASTRLIGPQRPSGRRLASPVECRAATPTSMILPGRYIGEAVRPGKAGMFSGRQSHRRKSQKPS